MCNCNCKGKCHKDDPIDLISAVLTTDEEEMGDIWMKMFKALQEDFYIDDVFEELLS